MLQNEHQPYDSNRPRVIHAADDVAPVMTFGEWVTIQILMLVPIVNFVMLIVWAAESNGNPNKLNWARATLVVMGIQVVLWIFLLGMFIGSVSHLLDSLNTSGLLNSY